LSTPVVMDVRSLSKPFGGQEALDGIDRSVRAGEISDVAGSLGPGGSATVRRLLAIGGRRKS
jgi:ABC-type sugar transport system ATPase subunit